MPGTLLINVSSREAPIGGAAAPGRLRALRVAAPRRVPTHPATLSLTGGAPGGSRGRQADEATFSRSRANRKRGHVPRGHHARQVAPSQRDGAAYNLLLAVSPTEGVLGYLLYVGSTTAAVYYFFMRYIVLPRVVAPAAPGRVFYDDKL